MLPSSLVCKVIMYMCRYVGRCFGCQTERGSGRWDILFLESSRMHLALHDDDETGLGYTYTGSSIHR